MPLLSRSVNLDAAATGTENPNSFFIKPAAPGVTTLHEEKAAEYACFNLIPESERGGLSQTQLGQQVLFDAQGPWVADQRLNADSGAFLERLRNRIAIGRTSGRVRPNQKTTVTWIGACYIDTDPLAGSSRMPPRATGENDHYGCFSIAVDGKAFAFAFTHLADTLQAQTIEREVLKPQSEKRESIISHFRQKHPVEILGQLSRHGDLAFNRTRRHPMDGPYGTFTIWLFHDPTKKLEKGCRPSMDEVLSRGLDPCSPQIFKLAAELKLHSSGRSWKTVNRDNFLSWCNRTIANGGDIASHPRYPLFAHRQLAAQGMLPPSAPMVFDFSDPALDKAVDDAVWPYDVVEQMASHPANGPSSHPSGALPLVEAPTLFGRKPALYHGLRNQRCWKIRNS